MFRPLWPSTRTLEKRENIGLSTLINALPKSFQQGLKQKIPLTSSASEEKSQGKEGKTHLTVMSLDTEVRRLGPGVTSLDPEVTRQGPKVMGSEGKSLIIALAPPPYASSHMRLRSGSKLCPPQKERSSSDKICSLREVPDGEGELRTFMFHSLCKTLPNARNNWAHIPRTPKNLRMNLGILALTSPSPGGI